MSYEVAITKIMSYWSQSIFPNYKRPPSGQVSTSRSISMLLMFGTLQFPSWNPVKCNKTFPKEPDFSENEILLIYARIWLLKLSYHFRNKNVLSHPWLARGNWISTTKLRVIYTRVHTNYALIRVNFTTTAATIQMTSFPRGIQTSLLWRKQNFFNPTIKGAIHSNFVELKLRFASNSIEISM